MSGADRQQLAGVLELLERRHGVGSRGERLPAWMASRLSHALSLLGERVQLSGAALLEHLEQEPIALGEIADVLRVGETSFYRDPPQWAALGEQVLPAFVRRERVRALSAGCSSGEEAWTLAMLLDAELPRTPFRVVGMDRSEVALASAREGVYPPLSARSLPDALGREYLTQDGESVRVVESLREKVSFVPRDVMLGPPAGRYEIIICKNVLIYFGDEAGARVVGKLMRSLAEGGVLLVAKSEVPRLKALGVESFEAAPGVTLFGAGLGR